MLDVTPSTRVWRDTIKPASPLLLLRPSDLTLLAGMPALRLLCLPLYEETFQGDDPRMRASFIQQTRLSLAFCGLLPRLLLVGNRAASCPALFQEAAFEGGLNADKLSKLQASMRAGWEAFDQGQQQYMLGPLRRAAIANQLSPQAAALLAALPAEPTCKSS